MAAFAQAMGLLLVDGLHRDRPEGPLDGLDDMKAVQLLCLEEVSAQILIIYWAGNHTCGPERGYRRPPGPPLSWGWEPGWTPVDDPSLTRNVSLLAS